uniref:CSON005486 protein n=1 Tax=Culicoides sonorensis TaxID=179676 RepID=A0A336N349_CULSO
MERTSRTKSFDHGRTLPEAPPNPSTDSGTVTTPTSPPPTIVIEPIQQIPVHRKDSDPFSRIGTYKDREKAFLSDLNDAIQQSSRPIREQPSPASTRESVYNDDSGLGNKGSDYWDSDDPGNENVSPDQIARECDEFLTPLISRTGPSVSVALSTKGALDQLDSLHKLVGQFLNLQEQNLRMTRATKSTNTLFGLKMIQNQIKDTPQKFIQDYGNENMSDIDFDMELEQNMALLEQILATGNSASKKRGSVKRERSKSALAEEIISDAPRNYPLRRQSAIVDFKPKVSKWTKVKAAFKWEKANALPDDIHSTSATSHQTKITGMPGKCKEITPVNTEVARYLRVPSIPCAGASSGDSVISSSSRDIAPEYLSSESSGDEMESKIMPKDSGQEHQKLLPKRYSMDDSVKRSRSLDCDQALPSNVTKQLEKAKSKSAWSKVKGMVKTHKASLKTSASHSSTSNQISLEGSRDVSPCGSIDMAIAAYDMERNDSFSSNQTSPGIRNPTPTFMITTPASDSGSHSTSTGILTQDELPRPPLRPVRKNKHIPEIQSLPEGEMLPPKSPTTIPAPAKKHGPPSPLNLKRDSSDAEMYECLSSPGRDSNAPIRPTTLSMPNSPMKSLEFFMDLESGEGSSLDYSESSTPQRRLSDKSRSLLKQREEIQNKYAELKKKLQNEFEAKQVEWDRIRPVLSTSPVHTIFKDEVKSNVVRPVVEENLPPDFKKKLEEWRTKKGQQSLKECSATSPKDSPKDPDKKKTDWEGWKTGQAKLPGQGLAILPNAKDLPEDFQKKLSEWKQLKATNKVPSYSTQSSTSGDSLKRNSLKKQISKRTGSVYGAVKKSRTAEDVGKHRIEGLSKLKALVTTEAPKKEVVVQTTKGVLKFEGISREFTRKLYKWEKSQKIKPEASTFALLHPGYQPVVVESDMTLSKEILKKREKSPAIQRSFSCDSISPNASHPSISHQPSSLSLNDMDDLKEQQMNRNPRRSTSQPNVESDGMELEEEPEAMIVEVEEDMEYLPDICRSPGISSDEALLGLDEDFLSIQTTIDAMRQSLQALIDCLPKMSVFMAQRTVPLQLIKQLCYEIIRLLNGLESHIDEKREIEPKVNAINERFNSLKEILDKVYLQKEFRLSPSSPTSINLNKSKKVPHLSVTPVYGAHAVKSIESELTNKATICVTPTYVCTEIKFTEFRNERKSSDRDLDSGTSQPHSSSIESETKENRAKLERNLSTGSRRKVRLRRMGSRQNSKTEESGSSEDEAMNFVLEAPRKVKRKTSKCKKNENDQVTQETGMTPSDDVVYVVKLKPTLTSENEVTFDFKTTPSNEGTIELMNEPAEIIPGPLTASVLIKTKRKLFSPIQTSASGEITAVTGIDLEGSTTETENKSNLQPKASESIQSIKKPPLPQSPRLQEQRKMSSGKEMAPNIRLMISKYNNKISSDSPKTPDASTKTSPWQSPVLDKRVQKQTAIFQEQIGLSKSNSSGSVKQQEIPGSPSIQITKSNSSKECSIKNLTVEKSLSSKELETDRYFDAKESFDNYYDTVLSYDTLKKKLMKDLEAQKTVCDDISKLADDVEKTWLEQKDTSKGAIKKIPKSMQSNYNRSISLSEHKQLNTAPKIFRKHDVNRPSLQASISVSPDSSYAETSSKPPKSPLSQRAEKLKKAKEEFLQMSIDLPNVTTMTEIDYSAKDKRLSQISNITVDSIDEPFIRKSKSSESAPIPDTISMDRHSVPTHSATHEPEFSGDNRSESSNSRFNLSNLASKFRKIKIRKNSKELPGAVTTLCRQSLQADITGESIKSEIGSTSSRSSLNEVTNVKKSESTHIFNRIFRPNREKLKKSRSLGLLVNIDDKRKLSKFGTY